MHTEENQPPADNFRYKSAAQEPARTARPQETGGALSSRPRAEEWSAFTPANDKFEDILLIPEEPLQSSAGPVVEVEVLEDVFRVEAAPTTSARGERLVVAGGGELRANVDEGSALHTSDAPSADEPAPVESFRAPAPAYDKYAVGMRILRISPAWLLLSTVGFISVIILFGWMFRPAGKAEALPLDVGVKNEATNQSPSPAPVVVPETAPAKPAEEAKQQPPQEPQPKPQERRAQEVTASEGAGAEAGNFTIQVGSYSDASQANERVSALRASGFEARAAAVEIPKRGTWYRVQAGRFQTREEAARFGAQLRAKGAADNVLIAEVEKR